MDNVKNFQNYKSKKDLGSVSKNQKKNMERYASDLEYIADLYNIKLVSDLEYISDLYNLKSDSDTSKKGENIN